MQLQLLAPDILADTCDMSLALVLLGLFLGLVLWLFGWWTHRFWVVLITTVLAGVYGLYEAEAFRAQPLVASVLLALAAGMLALAMVRLLAFLAGGLAGLLVLQALAPSWNQPFLGFLGCGLAGLFLFRLWMMALTSFSGTLLLTYAGLCLLNRSGSVDVVAWTEKGDVLFNWACALMTVLGLFFQFLLDRRRLAPRDKKWGKPSGPKDILLFPLWGWGLKLQRKAG